MKAILVICDVGQVSVLCMEALAAWLGEHGYEAFLLQVTEVTDSVKVIDLANLPPAELQEIREYCKKAVTA